MTKRALEEDEEEKAELAAGKKQVCLSLVQCLYIS